MSESLMDFDFDDKLLIREFENNSGLNKIRGNLVDGHFESTDSWKNSPLVMNRWLKYAIAKNDSELIDAIFDHYQVPRDLNIKQRLTYFYLISTVGCE